MSSKLAQSFHFVILCTLIFHVVTIIVEIPVDTDRPTFGHSYYVRPCNIHECSIDYCVS